MINILIYIKEHAWSIGELISLNVLNAVTLLITPMLQGDDPVSTRLNYLLIMSVVALNITKMIMAVVTKKRKDE